MSAQTACHAIAHTRPEARSRCAAEITTYRDPIDRSQGRARESRDANAAGIMAMT